MGQGLKWVGLILCDHGGNTIVRARTVVHNDQCFLNPMVNSTGSNTLRIEEGVAMGNRKVAIAGMAEGGSRHWYSNVQAVMRTAGIECDFQNGTQLNNGRTGARIMSSLKK